MLPISHPTKHDKGPDKGITDLNLHVEKVDLFAFIGHNGAGKTTTLKPSPVSTAMTQELF